MKNKAVVISGATSGIGFETAKKLACVGYTVIGIGRSDERCMRARQKILQSVPDADVRFVTANLYNQREVAQAALRVSKIIEEELRCELTVLINNAGCAHSYYTTTEGGIERQFALNYLSAFQLTFLLLPYIIRSKGRVIMTGSESHKGIKVHWGDIMLTNGYNPLTAYKQSKLCDILLAKGLNDRYASQGVRAYVVDPGLVKTDIGNKAGGIVKFAWSLRKPFGVSPEVPAETYVWLCERASHPDALYYHDSAPQTFSREVTSENAEKLFQISCRLCGIEGC